MCHTGWSRICNGILPLEFRKWENIMNIKKIFFLISFILINVVLIAISFKSHEMAKFILLFLVAEIALCEMVLRQIINNY